MNIGILGTGAVGRSHASRLAGLGHSIVMGTQDIEKTNAETKPDMMGNQPFSEWHKENAGIKLATFAEAAAFGEVVIDALKGEIAVKTLGTVASQLKDKILIDIAMPLDLSKGMPPSLFVCNTDSLGERVQAALPGTKVVKTFNTMNAHLQANPQSLAAGDHTIFVSGENAEAKMKVMEIQKAYGWKNILDLGGIATARGTEMLLPLWLSVWGALKDPMVGFKVISK